MSEANKKVWVTGGSGYVGKQVVAALVNMTDVAEVVSTDVRPTPRTSRIDGVRYLESDIRDPTLGAQLKEAGITTVVHLAAIVTPRPGDTRAFQYEVDVAGTQNVVAACVEAGVTQFVYTSSGAAYGYHADNAALLQEDSPLRGNEVFAYSWHKRLVEELLAEARAAHPELGQLVFRVSTVLGPAVRNQITAMFERPVVVGVRGSDTPFCFVADEDVVACILRGVETGLTGTYNLTADGVMTLREIAAAMGRRYVAVPEVVLQKGLAALSERKLTQLGPEQIIFLKHRPVLDNDRLKRGFGYRPERTSREVFERYRNSRA